MLQIIDISWSSIGIQLTAEVRNRCWEYGGEILDPEARRCQVTSDKLLPPITRKVRLSDVRVRCEGNLRQTQYSWEFDDGDR